MSPSKPCDICIMSLTDCSIVNINVHELNYNCRQYSLNIIDILKGIVHFISKIQNILGHVDMIAKNINHIV